MERLAPLPWQGPLWEQLVGWRERLPHALLLHGGRGIGKRHLATAFAQLLLCESPRAAQACGFDLAYAAAPTWEVYASFLELAATVRRDLRDLRPRDMIDVQSFIYRV